LDGNRGR